MVIGGYDDVTMRDYSTLAMAQKMLGCSDHVKMFGSERPAGHGIKQQVTRLIIIITIL